MSNIILKNWNPEGEYEYGFGIGYYFTKERTIMKDGEVITKPHNPSRQIRVFEELLQFMVNVSKENGGGFPFFVIDDCSPVKPEPDRVEEIVGDEPLLYVHLPKNVGCGGKENILQTVLGARCKYILRFDSDIRIDNLSLRELSKAFKKYKDAWAITSCITYFARVYAATLPEEQRYFAGSNIADFVAYRSSIFDKVGYFDPRCRRNSDGDMRLRIAAQLDMKCYVDRNITGKASPSGSGNTSDSTNKAARYVEVTRPFIRVSYPSRGNPRFALNKKKKNMAKGFYIPPMPFAEKLSKAVWKQGE
jgi:hypothetical protein